MAVPSKPSLLVIPGSFSTAQMYYAVLSSMHTLSPTLKTYVNNLPSATRNAPEEPASLQDDATFFRGLIEKLADRGEDVVLVAHSYGGLVGTEAVMGMSKVERHREGKDGGVVRIIYLNAHVSEAGPSSTNEIEEPPKGMVEVGEDGFLRFVDVQTIAKATFPDLDFEKAVEVVKSMGHQSYLSFRGKLTYAGYKNIPVSWILCENDFIIAPDVQRKCIDMIRRESGKEVDVHTLATGHCPNTTAPDKLAELVMRIVDASA